MTSLSADDATSFYLLICGSMVFLMQAGFTMLEVGCVRAKNVENIIFKNIMDACIGAIAFWAFGYAIAYGGDEEDNDFIGERNWFMNKTAERGSGWMSFFFQWAFAATAATIVSGSVAERCAEIGYFAYSFALTAVIYPIIVHWVWDGDGWLSAWAEDDDFIGDSVGLIDFAGSGVVHMVGGFAGLAGTFVMGPRLGRFDGPPIEPHNKPLAALGVLILWFGWYGFNCGSTLCTDGCMDLAGKVAVNTTLSAASSCVVCAVAARVISGAWQIMPPLNGVLAGLVGITASCPVVNDWGALAVGVISGAVYIGASKLLVLLKIDDPLDAWPVHGACGFWGVLAAGIFGTDDNVAYSGYPGASVAPDAIKDGDQFGMQLLGAIMIMLWTLGTAGPLFFGLHAAGVLRVNSFDENLGLDKSHHGATNAAEGQA